MIQKMKAVSVVMCTYNGAKYLREQLDSIVNQTYPIYELIVQDDCSRDETVNILKQYQQQYSFISIYVNEKNKGVTLNFMSAFAKAKGEYIAISDQDDVWMLDKIEKMINSISNELLCFSLSKHFSENGVPIDVELRVPNVGIERQIFYPIIPGHAMLFKTSLLDLIPKSYYGTYIYDHLLAITAIMYGNISVHNEVLTMHRRYVGAHSYVIPESYEKTIVNILRYVYTGFVRYIQKRAVMRSYFSTMRCFLLEFPLKQRYALETVQLTTYLSKKSWLSLIKASYLCVKMRKGLFYSQEKDGVVLVFRAALFPVLCSKYY